MTNWLKTWPALLSLLVMWTVGCVGASDDAEGDDASEEGDTEGMELTEAVFAQVMDGIRTNQAPLAYFQPKFIVEQVLASCKFEGVPPQFKPEYVDDALANLFVKDAESQMFGVAR